MRAFASALAVLASVCFAVAAPSGITSSSTTASASGSTCTTTPIPNPPKLLYCDETGHLDPAKVAAIDSVLEPKTSPNPFVACRTSCLNDLACISFGYDSSTRYCTRYTKPLRNQGFKKSSTSTTKFANRHCFKTTCTTPPLPPICTPSPTQAIQNGGFESTKNSSDSPPWGTQGNVQFVNNSQNAFSGNFYADLVADSYGDISYLYQSLSGLDPTKQYLLNFTLDLVSFNLDESRDSCSLLIELDGNTIYDLTYNSVYAVRPASGTYAWQAVTVQPSSNSAFLGISFYCRTESGTSTTDASEIYLDNVGFYDPDLSCAMYIQVTPSNTTVDNQFLYLTGNTSLGSNMGFTANIDTATQFSLDPYGQMFSIDPGYQTGYWYQNQGLRPPQLVAVSTLEAIEGAISNESDALTVCSIAPETFNLTCNNFGDTYFGDYNNYLALDYAYFTYVTQITLQISYVNYKSSG